MGNLHAGRAIAAEADGYRPDEAQNAGMQVCVLASGSKGNSIYIASGRFAILIDAGLSGVALQRRMAARGLDPANLRAIVVSHEHSDHISGVGVLSRRFKLPVYMSRRTAAAAADQLGKMAGLNHFCCGQDFDLGPFRFHPFSTSHDASDPAGFTISSGRYKVGLATDLGIATGMVKVHLKDCHLLIVEANHDPEMLIQGPYPWPLKQRIKSRLGHLSNPDAMELIESVCHRRLQHVILAHLSQTNNTPQMVRQALRERLSHLSARVRFHVAGQDCGTDIIRLGR